VLKNQHKGQAGLPELEFQERAAMGNSPSLHFSKRERQIVEAVYRLGEASVSQARAALPDSPSYSAVRAMLNLLVSKKVLVHRQEGKRYLYRPLAPKAKVGCSALKELVRNFFGGQPTDAVAAIIDGSAGRLKADDLARIKRLIEEAESQQ
jgi:BlaI family penicillinase repressor